MSLAVNVQQAIDETPLPAGNDALIAPFCVVVRRAAREASTSVCIESGALATSAKVRSARIDTSSLSAFVGLNPKP